MAITKVNSNDIGVFISTNLVTPAWKLATCVENNSLEGSADTNTRSTRCAVLKSRGATNWTASFTGVFNQTPDSAGTPPEISLDELHLLMASGASFLWKFEHMTTPSIYYRKGEGQFSSLTETANEGDLVEYDATIEVSGDIDTAP